MQQALPNSSRAVKTQNAGHPTRSKLALDSLSGFLMLFPTPSLPVGFPHGPDPVLPTHGWDTGSGLWFPCGSTYGSVGSSQEEWVGGIAGVHSVRLLGGSLPGTLHRLQSKGAGWKRLCFPCAAAHPLSMLANKSTLVFPQKVAEPVCWKSRGDRYGASPSGLDFSLFRVAPAGRAALVFL